MKRHLLIALILVVVVMAVLLCIPNKPASLTEQKTANRTPLRRQPHFTSENDHRDSRTTVPGSLPRVTMTAVEYKIDPFALNRERENPPFEFRGGQGTPGRVIDNQGNILIESSERVWVYGAAVSPDKEKVLVKRAENSGGCSLVLEPSTGREINLPSKPPGSNMFSLSWHWIGPDLLLGTSGVAKVFHEGPHENCCNDNNVAQIKLYTFDLVTQQLSEVVMPDAITWPVVNVADVMSDGHIHLLREEAPDGVDPNLGWFKIDASK